MRRSFTLIEVLISLSLFSLLLGTLFYWYRATHGQKEELHKMYHTQLEERYAHQRLQTILPSAELPLLSSEGQSLIFTFDRGIYPVPELSGKVLGRLYYDSSNEALCLGIWPFPHKDKIARTPSQTFIMLDQVTACSFRFYSPPDPFKKPVDPVEVGKMRPQEGWQTTWRGEYNKKPTFLEISIERAQTKEVKAHRIKYLFDFSDIILYPKQKL